jgi:hypothetical protein
MRHLFLFAAKILGLATGMMAAPPGGVLVPPAGFTDVATTGFVAAG